MKFLLLAYSHWIMSKKIGMVARRSSVKTQSYHNRVQLFEAQMDAILPCEQSLLRSSQISREEEEDSANGLEFLSIAAHPRKWMSQTSFDLVRPVFHCCA